MANVIRHTVVWSGSPGLPGYSQFYQEVVGDVAALAQAGHYAVGIFFDDLASLIPEEVSITVDPVYQVIVLGSGMTVGEDVVGDPATVIQGTYVGDWARQFGVLVEWVTGTFIDGKRLRGRTYLVPLGGTTATDGTVADATLATVRAAAEGITDGTPGFVVWHRPVAGVGGQISTITGAVVRDKAALLRSRML